MGKKKNLKEHVQSKKSGGYWKGGKKPSFTYEGEQYTGGRKKGAPNLVKLEDGKLQNQHGVEFTTAERKQLESLVNRVNRKRKKMLEEEGQLPRLVGGRDTGQKVKSLQVMGHESDFIPGRRSKSLQRFKSREDYNKYIRELQVVNSPNYIDEKTRLYKRNHMKAIENVFGDEGKDVIMKIRMMKPDEYRKLLQSDEMAEVNYVYGPDDASAKLNQIRASLNMKLKEESIFEE